MLRFLLLSLIVLSQVALAQTKLVFHPSFAKNQLFEDSLPLANGKIHFETLRFYISNVQVSKKGKTIWKEKNSYHLLDASDRQSLELTLFIPPTVSYDEVKFDLGIDSITNVSGALGGDLDPTKGMYWTWQSGYINLKIEGSSSVCLTRNHAFEFHLGGYSAPFASLQTIALSSAPAKVLNVYVDVAQFINTIDLSKENQVMSTGEEAVVLSKKAVKMFSTTKP